MTSDNINVVRYNTVTIFLAICLIVSVAYNYYLVYELQILIRNHVQSHQFSDADTQQLATSKLRANSSLSDATLPGTDSQIEITQEEEVAQRKFSEQDSANREKLNQFLQGK